MTGQEFATKIKSLGLKKAEVASRLGVDPDTVTARCKDAVVPALYEYALRGLAAEMALSRINEMLAGQ